VWLAAILVGKLAHARVSAPQTNEICVSHTRIRFLIEAALKENENQSLVSPHPI
jgi:hypothetical protein